MIEAPTSDSSRQRLLALGLLLAVTIAIRLPLIDVPFERDEGEYAYIAWRLPFGELPYRDWFNQKPPAVFWVYRAALALPIDGVRAVHLVALLFSAATAYGVYRLSRSFVTHPWAVLAGILFAAVSSDPFMQGTAANTEIFMLLPTVFAHLVFLRWRGSGVAARAAPVLTGALTGIAIAFKQVAAVNVPFFLAAIPFFVERGWRRRASVTQSLLFTGGLFAIVCGIGLYFAWHRALDDLIQSILVHNIRYVQVMAPADRAVLLRQALSTLAGSQGVVWLTAAFGLLGLALTRRFGPLAYLAAWLAASAVGVSAGGYYFPHYFQQIQPPLAILAAAGASTLYGAAPLRFAPPILRATAVLAVLAFLPAKTRAPFLFSYTPAEAVRKIYPGNGFDLMPEIGRRLAEMTKPGDRIYVLGSEPELFFYARRTSATRYIFLFPLFGPYPDLRQRQLEVLDEVQAAEPAAAVYLPNKLFYLPGVEQVLTEKSREYFATHFREDSYIVMDASGKGSLVPRPRAGKPDLPKGSYAVGMVLVRSPI